MIYFWSDTHFSHKLMMRQRNFSSLEELNESMIDRWNSTVTNKDSIYFLGDFSFATSVENSQKILNRLQGKKFFIKGNHDRNIHKLQGLNFVKEVHELKFMHQKYFLSHYCHYVWPSKHYGAIHLFGHSHGHIKFDENDDRACIDVGVDVFDKPVSIIEINDILLPIAQRHAEKLRILWKKKT